MMTVLPLKNRLLEYAELVKFEHTVFALPFALSALILAAPVGIWPPLMTVFWVLLAMVGGRTYAMGLNRILDAEIDAQNPRTQGRSIPAGRVAKKEAWTLTLLAGGLLIGATLQLPLLCQMLLPVAFGILTVYSYMKRFSHLAHLVLGLALGSSAIGGWFALSGTWSWLPVLLGFSVLFWVSGFDILYACQDVDFDRSAKLHSIPAAVGIENALKLSKLSHVLAVVLLAAFTVSYAWAYEISVWGLGFGTLMMAGFLVYEHQLISSSDLSQINEAFFTVNGRISLSVLIFVILDKCLQML